MYVLLFIEDQHTFCDLQAQITALEEFSRLWVRKNGKDGGEEKVELEPSELTEGYGVGLFALAAIMMPGIRRDNQAGFIT